MLLPLPFLENRPGYSVSKRGEETRLVLFANKVFVMSTAPIKEAIRCNKQVIVNSEISAGVGASFQPKPTTHVDLFTVRFPAKFPLDFVVVRSQPEVGASRPDC